MKRISILMLLIVCVMVGCKNTEPQETPETTSETEEKEVKIYLVRHGKTFFNTTGQVQGWADSPLTDVGAAQGEAVGVGLKDIPFATAFSSDLGRQRATAQKILAQNAHEIPQLQEEIGLREWFYGGYEGKTNEEMWTPMFETHGLKFDEEWSQYGELTTLMTDEEIANTIAANDELGEAENYEAIMKRTQEAMDAIIKATQAVGGGNALVVSSGGEIPSILELVVPGQYQSEDISNCSVSILNYKDGVYSVEVIGDTSYLEAGQK